MLLVSIQFELQMKNIHVWKFTCVRVAHHVGVRGLADGLDEGAHLGGTKRAVQADAAGKKSISYNFAKKVLF